MGLCPEALPPALEGLEEEEGGGWAVARDPSLRRSLPLSLDPSRPPPLLRWDRSGVLFGRAPEPGRLGGPGGSWSLGRVDVIRPWGKPLSLGFGALIPARSCSPALLKGPLPGADCARALESVPLPLASAPLPLAGMGLAYRL